MEREEREGVATAWRLRIVWSPAGRSVLPGESRPAHQPRQRCQLHSAVRERLCLCQGLLTIVIFNVRLFDNSVLKCHIRIGYCFLDVDTYVLIMSNSIPLLLELLLDA